VLTTLRDQILLNLIEHVHRHAQTTGRDSYQEGFYHDSINRPRGHTLTDLFIGCVATFKREQESRWRADRF
jgi:hypothetical protein